MNFKSQYLECCGRELHYTEWGAQHTRTVLACHGLARTCRDMDELAQSLSRQYRVLCPDMIGRGLSQWSPDPQSEYCLAFYEELLRSFADQLGLQQFDWVGTSMGGAIGTRAAARSLRGRIGKLVLNDNGPELAQAAIARIRGYAGNPSTFATIRELEQYFRTVYKPYGWLSDAQWRRLTETSARRLPDGRVTPHYDPAMVMQFTHHQDDYLLWEDWDRLDIPVLCLRGESSDLLLPDVTQQMRQRGPRATVIEIPGCGHAPALNTPAQLALIDRFLAGHPAAEPVTGPAATR